MCLDKTKKNGAEEKFKEINNAFRYIKKYHNSTNNFYGNIENNMDFKNFTEKIINKGEILRNIINNAKNIDLKDFFTNFFGHIKKFRFLYDDMFSDEKTNDMIVNINVSLEDIFNKEDKIVKLVRNRKCQNCYNNDLKFCTICDNKIYFKQKKVFIFNCSDKIIIFNNEADEEKNKKTGDLIIKIHPKPHSNFKLINNYDIYYEIYTTELKNITHNFIYLDNKSFTFTSDFPFRESYVFENKGLPHPYSDNIGNLIIKIIYKPFDYKQNTNYKLITN